MIAERNKSVLQNIIWDPKEVINRALTKFGESIALDAVFANMYKDVEHLEVEKAILDTRLNNLTAQPPAPTGKPKLYFVRMFEPYYDYSYAWELLVCCLCIISIYLLEQLASLICLIGPE